MNETNFYAWHEGDMARMERANKRLWVVIIILIVALCGSNFAWILYEAQFEVVEETTQIEAEQETTKGNNYVVGGNYNAETKSEDHKDN